MTLTFISGGKLTGCQAGENTGPHVLWKWAPGGSRGACWLLKPPWHFSCKSSSKIASSEQAFPLSSSSCFPPSGTTFRIGANVCMCPCFTPFVDTEWYATVQQPRVKWLYWTFSKVPRMSQVSLPCFSLTSCSTMAGPLWLKVLPSMQPLWPLEKSWRNHSSSP